MWKVTVKGLLAKKLRFLLTGVAVLLGVAFMAGTMVLTDTVQAAFDDLYADINEEVDAVVRGVEPFEAQFGETREPIPARLIRTVREVDGVADAHGFVQTYAQLVDKEGDAIGRPDAGPPALGMGWIDDEVLNPFTLQPESRAPVANDEIVIDKGSADRGDLEIGDTVTVLSQQVPKDYQIIGVVKFGTVDSPLGASIVLFAPREAQRVAGYDAKFDEILLRADEGVSQEQLKGNLQAALSDEDVEVLTGAEVIQEGQDEIREQLGFFNTGLLIFAVVALFVGSFIIYNTFSIIVAQRSREMALLRAIGAGRAQVLASVLGESALVGLTAAALGVGAGIGLSIGLKQIFSLIGIDIPAGAPVVTPGTVVTSLVVGLVVTLVAAVVPARRASRVPPVAAMRDVAFERSDRFARRTVIGVAITALGVALLLAGLFTDVDNAILYVGLGAGVIFIGVFVLGPLFSRPVSRLLGAPLPKLKGMTGTLARENAARNPRRTSATAAALMIGVALVGFITIFAASTKESIGVALDEQITADYIVTSGTGFGIGFSPKLGEALRGLPEIDAVTPIRFGPVEIDGTSEFLVAASGRDSEKLFDFGVEEGALSALGPDSIGVSRRTADDKGWQLGDEIPITFARTGEQRIRIDAIYEKTEVADDYLMSLEGFEKHFTDQLDIQVFAMLRDGVSPEEGRAAIEPLLEDYPTADLRDQAQFKADQEAQINQIVALIYVMLALAVIIAVIGIANTLALSIYERTRELGLLRAVGMSRAQVRSTVRWESVIISLLGTALGLVIGLFFGWAVVTALRDEGFKEFAIAPVNLAVVVVLAAVFGVIAAIGPARRAARLDVLRAIASE